MMAVLESILPVVSRSSVLALELYRVATLCQNEVTKDLIKAASATNSFASILKQIGTIIQENDRLPSHEAIEMLEDIIEQSQFVSSEIESLASFADDQKHIVNDGGHFDSHRAPYRDSPSTTRLAYMTAHLEALKATFSVLLQTLNTAQSIIWSKHRPTILPQQAAKAVANERLQLETLITEQQMSILSATNLHEQISLGESLLLMEADSSQSLIAAERGDGPSPADLHRYQYLGKDFGDLDKVSSTASSWLLAIRNITSSQSEHLLDRWTCLPRIDAQLREAERETRTRQRESQQPMVESDSEDDRDQNQRLAGAGTRMRASQQRSGSAQPLFTETNALPIPTRDSKYGPTAPLSPVASPRTSQHSLAASSNEQELPVSPQSSISSLPVEAAAAVEAQEEDEDINLEIPWQLCTRKYYWKYIDGKVVGRNTDQLPSIAYLERNSWTEIMASWVCKEAIREAGYRFTQVQKDRQEGRRTKFETCFCIEQPLQFEQVKQLVERTVEIYRKKKPPSPLPRVRRSSFNRPPPIDRDRTPVPHKTHPPMGRPGSSMPIPPLVPPPLSRSISTPGPGPMPGFQNGPNPHTSNLHIPISPVPYSISMPQGPYSPQMPQGPYSPQLYNSPQAMYSPNNAFQNPGLAPHLQLHNLGMPQSPLRQSYLHPNAKSKHDDDFMTSESDSGKDRRRRRSKSKSRDVRKKSYNKSKAAGVLMGVGGLTALLDGLSGL